MSTQVRGKLELFSFAACPYAQRTRMTLIEKDLEFDLIEVDLFDRPEWFSEVSPYGKVPVLRHQGRTLYESAIINEYLDEAFPEPPMMPADPLDRAVARIWMHYCESRLLPALGALTRPPAGKDKQESASDRIAALCESMRFIEQEGLRKISDGPFWFGEHISLVDLQFAPFFERFGVYEQLDGAVWPDDCTRLSGWLDAMRQRQSWQRTAMPLDEHIHARQTLTERLAARRRAAAAG